MILLELSFPAGRFHATPWGRHVNEGAVEWPPSPWRIVRSLVATWHLKAREIPEPIVRSIVGKLCAAPAYYLPKAVTAHTRHYMPYNEGPNEKTTKVFDTFVQMGQSGSIFVKWDAKLLPEEEQSLKQISERLGYLGRAESLVQGSLPEILPDNISDSHWSSLPMMDGKSPPNDHEITQLLAPMSEADFQQWKFRFLANVTATPEKKSSKKRSKSPEVPVDVFDALHAETGSLQAAGWNLPPGAIYLNYSRPENVFAPPAKPRPARMGPSPTTARFQVVSAVSPRITKALSVGHRLHVTLCSLTDSNEGPLNVFSGADETRKPLEGNKHSHIFCEVNGPRHAITHITVWAPMGLDEEACIALRKVRKIWGYGGHDIHLVLEAIGDLETFSNCPIFHRARKWRSATPFVSTRHAKTFNDGRPKIDLENGWQIGSPGHDLLRLLAIHPQGKGAKIRKLDEGNYPLACGIEKRGLRSLQFQTRRKDGGGSRGNDNGSAFEIEFADERQGPFALGYGAHFGLGLFVPMD